MAEKIVSAINRALLPQLQEMSGELKAINARLDAADTKADSFRNEFRSEIKRFEDKVEAMKSELRSDILRVDQKVDFAKEFEILRSR